MSEPESVLEGKGKTDYEKYLKIVDLLSCQKAPEKLVNHDELLFQVMHQTAELWMKLEIYELTHVRELLRSGELLRAARLLQRVREVHEVLTAQIHILETMSPWDYHAIRRHLGRGSGLESPGFQKLLVLGPTLWAPFQALLKEREVDLERLYVEKESAFDLFLLAEALADFDEQFQLWRFHHLKLVEREIGGKVMSLKGRAVDYLSENMEQRFFPALWEVRNRLTHRAGTSYGAGHGEGSDG